MTNDPNRRFGSRPAHILRWCVLNDLPSVRGALPARAHTTIVACVGVSSDGKEPVSQGLRPRTCRLGARRSGCGSAFGPRVRPANGRARTVFRPPRHAHSPLVAVCQHAIFAASRSAVSVVACSRRGLSRAGCLPRPPCCRCWWCPAQGCQVRADRGAEAGDSRGFRLVRHGCVLGIGGAARLCWRC